jgi:hypothetical protein
VTGLIDAVAVLGLGRGKQVIELAADVGINFRRFLGAM